MGNYLSSRTLTLAEMARKERNGLFLSPRAKAAVLQKAAREQREYRRLEAEQRQKKEFGGGPCDGDAS
jgi:hypothetical protein